MRTAIRIPNRQQGAALFVSLMFLIILTLVGLSAANVGILQERMAGNMRETNVAFQNAEATLREIEQRLVQISEGGSGGLPATIPVWADAIDDLGISRFDCTLSGIEPDDIPWETAPTTGNDYYLVELTDTVNIDGLIFGSACRPMNEVGLGASSRYFLVVARAQGPAGVGERIVQSIFYYPA
jgi:type IV pilus assembly protein PilX